jgi:D-arabinitol dehydrogenase (NADP+)
MDMIDVQCGDTVLMFGAGPTGIILAQLLKHGGAGKVVVAAPSQFKLDILGKMGMQTVQIKRDDDSASFEEIMSHSPKGYDIIIDATGASSITQQCFKYAKKGSKIVIYGVCDSADKIEVSPYDIFSNEYKIIGSFAQTHCFDRAVNALETGIVKVKDLISHKFSLDDYAKGLDAVISGKESIKVVIYP